MKGKIKMALVRLSTISNNGKTTHVKVALKRGEAKAFIMKTYGWTEEQYNKQYDIFRNKLRASERFYSSQGIPVKSQSVIEVLYKEAKAVRHYGADYEPSINMQRILSFSSVSSGKVGKKQVTSASYNAKRLAMFSASSYDRFSGLIENNPKAKEIWENVKNPIMRERALTDYANQLNIEIETRKKASKNKAISGNIPFGETFGSSSLIDFDYSAYQLWDDEL